MQNTGLRGTSPSAAGPHAGPSLHFARLSCVSHFVLALYIVSVVVVLAPGPMQAQDSAEIDRTMSAVPMPGGLAAARAALGESETADAATCSRT